MEVENLDFTRLVRTVVPLVFLRVIGLGPGMKGCLPLFLAVRGPLH